MLAYLDQQEEALKREAREYLAGVAEPLRNGPTPLNVKIDVRLGDPASGIAMAALDTQADLIVMATHGRTGIQRAMLGSVAGTVLRTACTPVTPGPPEALLRRQTRARRSLPRGSSDQFLLLDGGATLTGAGGIATQGGGPQTTPAGVALTSTQPLDPAQHTQDYHDRTITLTQEDGVVFA